MDKLNLNTILLAYIFSTQSFAATVPTSASSPLPSIHRTENIDTVLSEKVQAKITQTKILRGEHVTAASHNQIILLQGSVKTKEQADAAIQAAKSIPDVKGVRSDLTITYQSSKSHIDGNDK